MTRARVSVAALLALIVVSMSPGNPASAAPAHAKTRELEQRRREIEKKKGGRRG